MQSRDFLLLVITSTLMLVVPWQSEIYSKAASCGCTTCSNNADDADSDGQDETPAPTTANILITAIENHWGWKQGWEFKLESTDGTYSKSVAVATETAKKFQHLFTDVPLKKALVFYTPSQVRSYTYHAFQLPSDGTETFELTGTGYPYPCGMTTCIEWSWMESWSAS